VRYQHLLEGLRCLVCQDENLAASSAPLAADLRRQVRHMIDAGKSDNQIRDYMVARYGDFVLYKPPFMPLTWLLWIGPFAFLAVGLSLVLVLVHRSRHAGASGSQVGDAEMLERGRCLLEREERRRS
jgi:cytochrome c-type biogenesis protein CcmH